MNKWFWVLGVIAWGTVQAGELQKAPTARVAPVQIQERQAVDTMRQLGFDVAGARHLGNGNWEVQVNSFDARRASGAFRGAIVAPAAQVGNARSGTAAREAAKGGRSGTLRPRGGGARSEQDGSATGGGNSGPDNSSGGGRDGGPLPGNDSNEGGSATGGGQGGGVEPSTNPRGRAAALRLSIGADGKMVVDAASLRQAGYAHAVGQTANGQVSFR